MSSSPSDARNHLALIGMQDPCSSVAWSAGMAAGKTRGSGFSLLASLPFLYHEQLLLTITRSVTISGALAPAAAFALGLMT